MSADEPVNFHLDPYPQNWEIESNAHTAIMRKKEALVVPESDMQAVAIVQPAAAAPMSPIRPFNPAIDTNPDTALGKQADGMLVTN